MLSGYRVRVATACQAGHANAVPTALGDWGWGQDY